MILYIVHNQPTEIEELGTSCYMNRLGLITYFGYDLHISDRQSRDKPLKVLMKCNILVNVFTSILNWYIAQYLLDIT